VNINAPELAIRIENQKDSWHYCSIVL